MKFLRTNSGISSRNVFSNVDFMVYSEGGDPGRTCSDGSIWAIDAVFWRNVFRRFLPAIRVKICCLGSKSNVMPYAEKVFKDSVNNTIVVMDRDHDAHCRRVIEHPRVLYTRGYSWENDVFRPEIVISLLGYLHPDGEIPDLWAEDIRARFREFIKSLNRAVFVDVLCSIEGIKGIDRGRYASLMELDKAGSLTRLKKESFKRMVAEVKARRQGPLRYTGPSRVEPWLDCYGKIMAQYGYGVYLEYYRKITGHKNLARVAADNAFAQSFQTADIEKDESLFEYYTAAFDLISE